MLSNFLGLSRQPYKPGSACKPVPGYQMHIVDPKTKHILGPGKLGTIVMGLPTPPSFMLGIWNHEEAFIEKYFKHIPGYYETGDSGHIDQDGYFYIMTRVDDIINTAGHRISTGEIEEVLMKHPTVAEAIAVGVNDEIKGEVPVGFVTLK
jgi:propionyl-CoA synthetase